MMQEHTPPITPPSPTATLSNGTRRISFASFLGIAMVFAIAGGAYWSMRDGRALNANVTGAEESEQPPESQAPDYRKWDRPDVAIVFSGQMYGYIDPCGCSEPQYGGLPRRFNFIQSLKAKSWDVVGIDLGELPALRGIPDQNFLKYELTVRALERMDYKVFGIGRTEILSGLGEHLSQINDPKLRLPRPINLSLAEAAPGARFHKNLNLRQYEIIATTKPRIGVINMIGPDAREEVKNKEPFANNIEELPKALAAFAEAGVEIGVILHHEFPKLDPKIQPGGIQARQLIEKQREEQTRLIAEFCHEARQKNPKIPAIQLVVILSEDSEALGELIPLADNLPTKVLQLGQKGKYVGLVGVIGDKGAYRLEYQKILMEPAWKEPQDNEITRLMEAYNSVLKKRNMLDRVVRSPHANQIEQNAKGLTATYVGSGACKNCHKSAFEVWSQSTEEPWHGKATDTLEKLKNPAGRHYDPECMRCHVTGLEQPGGYNDLIKNLAGWEPNKQNAIDPDDLAAHNKKLRGVGCESCHGPGSQHVKIANMRDPTIAERERLNPYRPTVEERKLQLVPARNAQQQQRFHQLQTTRMNALERFCTQCHDQENDVNWGKVGTLDKWLQIIHRTDPAENAIRKKAAAPAVKNDAGSPPIIIEVIDDKKK